MMIRLLRLLNPCPPRSWPISAAVSTTTGLVLTYGGGDGNCLKNIGTGFFEVAPTIGLPGCTLVESVRSLDTSAASLVRWTLPAQNYTVTLQSNLPAEVQGEDVIAFFLGENNVLPTEDQAGLTRKVRFVRDVDGASKFLFRVVPTIERKSVEPVNREDCLRDDDLIVVDQDTEFTITINLFELYLGDAPICHNVSGSIVMAESVSEGGAGTGETQVLVRTVGNLAVEAVAELKITAGPPELLPPHLKRVRIVYGQMRPPSEQDFLSTGKRIGKGRIKADVVVEGQVDLAVGQTFAMPEFVPFLILRDPPGDGSSASFASSHSASLNVGLSKETSDGFTEELVAGVVALKTKDGSCVGAIAAYACIQLVEGNNCKNSLRTCKIALHL